jgi:translocation protein SEC66
VHPITAKAIDPYFPSHPERDLYVTLLQRQDPPTPDAILKAALVRRAMTDVARVLRIREDKPALQGLLQKGSIGDDFWNSLLAAEKELEAEIMEVVAEANSFVEGWGGVIFETASQMIANEKMRSLMENTPAARAEKGQHFSRPPMHTLTESAEVMYGRKAKLIAMQGPPDTPKTPASAQTPSTPATPASAQAASEHVNGLLSPSGAGTESVAASSDGEGSNPSTPSKSKAR